MAIKPHHEGKNNLPDVVKIFGRGVGAAAANLTGVQGVVSVVHTGTGLYTVNLPRKYAGLLNLQWQVISTTAANWLVTVISENVVGASATAGSIAISVLSSAAGSAAAPAAANLSTAQTLLLEITVADTDTKPSGF